MIRSRNEIPLTSRAANYTLVLVMLSRETTNDVAVSFLQPRTRTRDDPRTFNRSTIPILYPDLRHVLPFLLLLLLFFPLFNQPQNSQDFISRLPWPAIPLEIAAISRANEPLCKQSPRVSTLYFNRLLSFHSKRQNQDPLIPRAPSRSLPSPDSNGIIKILTWRRDDFKLLFFSFQ